MSEDYENGRIALAEREALIKNHPFFYLLKDEDTKYFVSQMQESYVASGDIVVRENDVIDRIYFIADGTAEVTRVVSRVGKAVTLHVCSLGKGDAIGLTQTGFFSGSGMRTATVTALSPMVLLSIDLPVLYSLSNYPALKKLGEQFLLMSFIRHTHLFNSLSNDHIRRLSQSIKKANIVANTKIFSKNDPADKCYLILSGEIIIKNLDQNNMEYAQTVLKPGSFVGKAALLPEGNYDVSAYTKTDCEMFELERAINLQIVASHKKATTSWGKRLVKGIKKFFRKKERHNLGKR